MRRWAWCLGLVVAVAAGGTAGAGLPAASVLEGYIALRGGDAEGALDAFRRALADDPDSAAIRAEIIRILGSRKDYDDALTVVDDGLRRRPEHPELLLLRARLLRALDRPGEAAAAAKRAAEVGGSEEAYGLAVRLLEAGGRADDALALTARWSEAHPDDPEAWFARGRILIRRGDADGAHRALRKVLGLDPNHRAGLRALAALEEDQDNLAAAEALYRRVIEANPHDVEARFRLGQLLIKQDRAAEAVEEFQAAERWSGGNANLRFQLGLLLLQSDRAAEAETVFLAMAKANGDDVRAWYLLGVSRLAQEKYPEAIEALDRVPPTALSYPDALIRKAFALQGLERREEARSLLRGWLDDHPADEEVRLALAGLFEEEGDYRSAADLIESYLAGHETDNAKVYFTLGVLYDKLKDWRRSAEYMKQCLDRDPDDAHALNYLGYTYAEHGVNLEEAERLILRAIELKPDNGFIIDSLGWVYFRQGRYDEAVATLKKALETAPEDPVIWEHLGDAYLALGDGDQARDAYRKALDLSPDSEEVQRKLEDLR